MVGTTLYPEKMELFTINLTEPQYSNKQVSISFFVSFGPHILTTSVSMVLFKSLLHVCKARYLKPTILAFFGSPRLVQNGQFGLFCY